MEKHADLLITGAEDVYGQGHGHSHGHGNGHHVHTTANVERLITEISKKK